MRPRLDGLQEEARRLRQLNFPGWSLQTHFCLNSEHAGCQNPCTQNTAPARTSKPCFRIFLQQIGKRVHHGMAEC
jgi:hypothetical protein